MGKGHNGTSKNSSASLSMRSIQKVDSIPTLDSFAVKRPALWDGAMMSYNHYDSDA